MTKRFALLSSLALVTGALVSPAEAVVRHCPAPWNYEDGSPGTAGIVPSISHTGLPHPGFPNFEVHLTHALGGAPAVLGIGLGSAKIPVMGINLLLDPADPLILLPATTSGVAGLPGEGTASFSFAMPTIIPLNGTQVFAQWVILDPGASQGLSASDGLLVHIHTC